MLQIYLVFISAKKYFKLFSGTNIHGNCSSILLDYFSLSDLKFVGNCLINSNVFYFYGRPINVYISYMLNAWSKDLKTDFTLSNCLFGMFDLTTNAGPDKHAYSSYSIV